MPALVGAPKPMVVRQAIMVGRSLFCAASIAAAISSGFCPSMRLAFHPAALKRATWSPDSDERQRPVDRDAVVVEEDDQLAQPEVAGDRDRLVADPLHQVAVGGDDVGVVVDDVVAELCGHQPFGERHADGVAEPLAERTGGGLDAGGDEVLRVPRRLRAELPEVPDLVHRHPLDAEEIEDRIEQHRAVAGGEHEAVAVGPARLGRVEFEVAGEQHGRDIGHAHRHAGMARFGAFNGIHGERADRIRHTLVLDEVGHEAWPDPVPGKWRQI